MLGPERETVRTLGRNPGLFVGGAVAAVAWLVAHAVAAAPVLFVTLPRDTQMAFALPLAGVVSVLVLPPALAGLYATAREGREAAGLDLVRSLETYVQGCLRHARDLTVATVVFRATALVPAAAVFVVLLAGDTTVNYWQYAHGASRAGSGIGELVVVWLYAMVAGALGRLTLAFYDLPVLFAGVPPRRCWRAALRFARRRPRSLVRYGAGRLLLWLPMVAVLVLEVKLLTGDVSPTGALQSVALFVPSALGVGAVTATLIATYHVVVYERTVEPVLREPTPTGGGASQGSVGFGSPAAAPPGGDEGRRTRRVAVAVAFAVLLVTATAAGTTAIRVDDARPMPSDHPRSIEDSMDGDAVARNAGRVLATASYRASERNYRIDGATGDRRLVYAEDVAIDRRVRRARVSVRIREGTSDEWQHAAYYGSEATLAMDMPGDQEAPDEVPLSERFFGRPAGEWGVIYVPGYPMVAPGSATDLPDGDLAILERGDGSVVVGSTDRPDEDPPADGDALAVERIRLTVDRETGRPTRLVENRTFVEYDDGTEVERYRTVKAVTYSDYDSPGVERPDPIGPRGPVEWLWDLVYY